MSAKPKKAKAKRVLLARKFFKDLDAVLGSRMPKSYLQDVSQFKQYVTKLERTVKLFKHLAENNSFLLKGGRYNIIAYRESIDRAFRRLEKLSKI